MILFIIIHQTHYEKSDWSRAFNQFTIACELDMINAISAADIAFTMSSSKSAWLLSPLECSPQKQNGWMLRFCFWGWIIRLCYLPQPSASADNTDLGFDNSWYHAKTKFNNCFIIHFSHNSSSEKRSVQPFCLGLVTIQTLNLTW